MNCKRLEVELEQKEHNAEMIDMGGFDITKEPMNEFELSYCVMYRPLGLPEWILDRGWWNDLGLWTEDGIFNDGII